jgi:hypothetical protein
MLLSPGNLKIKIQTTAGHQWLTSIILATWEVDIERIAVQGQLGQIVHETTPK